MTSPLSEVDGIDGLKRALEAKRTELLGRDAEGITIERAADSMDELVLANERDLAVETLNRKALDEAILELQAVDAGFRRTAENIVKRDYGIAKLKRRLDARVKA